MKIRKGFLLREVGGEPVVVTVGETEGGFRGMISLNSTGAFIWKCLEQDTTQEEVLEKIIDAYPVDRETAANDLQRVLSALRDHHILEEP